MIYEPREDSLLLEKEVKKYSENKKVLDMGSGSGIQSLAAIHSGAKYVLATDIDAEVLSNLKKKKINSIYSDLFSNVKEKFDLIAFNPPYLPEDKNENKESSKITSGGKKGDEIILRFLREASKYLNNGGIILLLLSSLTPTKRINSLLIKKGLSKKILSEKKFFMESIFVLMLKKQVLKTKKLIKKDG